MFKQRLRKWGCRKNISLKGEDEETLRQIFQQQQQQDPVYSYHSHNTQHHHPQTQQQQLHRHGQPSQYSQDIKLANGQITTVDRLATHLRRKHDYYGRRKQHSQQQQQQVITIVKQKPLPSLADPQTFRVSEAVLYQVRTFIISRFKDDDQRPEPLAADGPKLVVQWRSYSDWLAYCNRIGVALRHHRLDEALREMRVGPEWITTILKSISGENQIPNVVGMLFYFLITVTRHRGHLTADNKKQLFVVVRALIKYAAQAGRQDGLPETIVRLLQSIWYVDDDAMLFELSNKAWQMTCQTWGANVPGYIAGRGAGEEDIPSPSASQQQQQQQPSPSPSPDTGNTTNNPLQKASWTNIFASASPEDEEEEDTIALLPPTDIVIASATSQLSRRTYAELLILHASYLHSAISAQERNPSLDDRLVGIFQLISQVSQDPSHLCSVYTQLMLAYHYRGDWALVAHYRPLLFWALANAPNDFLRVWVVITVKGHVGRLTEAGEVDTARRMAGWLAEVEAMAWPVKKEDAVKPLSDEVQAAAENSLKTPPPDIPDMDKETIPRGSATDY